jgi:alpha-ketoglutarate-dependent 2,4-dichlorophenoxyacetate dioxygenase
MKLVPLGADFGVEIRGLTLVDVATSDEAYQAVRAAFEEHSVLLFRDQQVSDDLQVAFSRAFGPLELVKVGSVGAGTFFTRLHNIAEDGSLVPETHRQALTARANQLWHTDSSFKRTPALASVLSARVIPPHDGQTQLTSGRGAWARLSPAMQAQLRDAVVTHAYGYSRDQIDPALMTQPERDALPPVRWRMTWRNPVNGRIALYIASHAYAIEGLTTAEARALLDELIAEATRPDVIYEHQWRPGDVLMWDNRATMHRGRPWPHDQPRSVVRTTISARDVDGLPDVRPTPSAPREDTAASRQPPRSAQAR